VKQKYYTDIEGPDIVKKPYKWQNLKLNMYVVFKPVCRYVNRSVGLIQKSR